MIDGDSLPLSLEVDGQRVFIGDAVMRHAYAELERLAAVDMAVLITGETGTGKELAARALHAWSSRSRSPIVKFNSALPDFEMASGGTVFLDEIGDVGLAVQAKLMMALKPRAISRSSGRKFPPDVRIISATHRNLALDVESGRFRSDLYRRLSESEVRLPALRDRPIDLPLLAQMFLADARRELDLPPLTISATAMSDLRKYRWPGNVRELKNVMEYLALLVDGTEVDPDHVAPRLHDWSDRPPPAPPGSDPALASHQLLGEATRFFERRRIEAALATTGGNKTRAAQLLGVPLRTFMAKLKRHGVR